MAFKMKGHGLPGINQRMDKSSLEDGRAKSSAFQAKTSTVEVSGGDKPERHSDKWKRVKGMEGDPIKNMESEYGGTWTREDRSKKGGSKGTLVNEKGQTAKEAAIAQGQAQNKAKREYIAKNKTKN